MSHLASADEDSAQNEAQRALFAELVARMSRIGAAAWPTAPASRLGEGYAFDLTRPGPRALRRRSAARAVGPYPPGRLPAGGGDPVARSLSRRQGRLQRGVHCANGRCARRRFRSAMPMASCAAGRARGIALRQGRTAAARQGFDGHGRRRLSAMRRSCAKATGSTFHIDCRCGSANGFSQYELLTTLGSRFSTTELTDECCAALAASAKCPLGACNIGEQGRGSCTSRRR